MTTTRTLFTLVSLLILAACAQSPTAPTPTAAAVAGPLYRWDVLALDADCVVASPRPDLTAIAPSSVVPLPDGVTVRAFYTQGAPAANGDQDMIGGDFRRVDKVFGLCRWARYTRGVNP